jgi:hypothetical protein
MTDNAWRNRIVGHGSKPADQFQANPGNFRTHPKHQQRAVKASLNTLGWVGVLSEIMPQILFLTPFLAVALHSLPVTA